jgi:hypothetical protein
MTFHMCGAHEKKGMNFADEVLVSLLQQLLSFRRRIRKPVV